MYELALIADLSTIRLLQCATYQEVCIKKQDKMKYQQIESLEEFLNEVEVALLNEEARVLVKYLPENTAPWNAVQIENDNVDLLSSVTNAANVYAIFTSSKGAENFALRYIGKTTLKLSRQRIRNHLIKKHEKTGAKLWKIISHVQSGGSVKLSWIRIEPESLRNYVEEELIKRHNEADWNRENS